MLVPLLLGCAPAKLADDGDAGSSGSSSGSAAQTDDAGTSATTTGEGTTASSADASSESSTGEAPPVCGNGVVEGDEQCDGEPGCEDCARTCSFGTPIDLLLTAQSWTTSTTVPVALTDGSGDLLVTSGAGLHRVAPDGTELWVQSESTSTWRVLTMTAADADSVWLGWITDDDGWTARYTRNAVADGSELESFDVGDGAESSGDAVFATPDALYVASSVTTPELGKFARVEHRDAVGTAVQWTADLLDDGRDAYDSRFVLDLALGSDGTLFAAGAARLDADAIDNEIAALAPDGTLRWRRSFDTSAQYGGARRPWPLTDGGVVTIVREQHNDFGTVGNTPGFFTWLARLDAEGEIAWQVDPTDAIDEYRVQLTAVQPLDDRFVVAGALVDDNGNAAAWLGYLDADGALTCSTAVVHPNGEPAAIDAIFATADGGLAVQGFTDDDQPGSAATSRWYAPVYPY